MEGCVKGGKEKEKGGFVASLFFLFCKFAYLCPCELNGGTLELGLNGIFLGLNKIDFLDL
ncbi:MAG: hypothetical protein RLZZ628_1548 [Bacteroidota bacterium]|jgi:hypothetical protein